jgi:NAD(P)-dependent dehydrogenase (short-subunit alcohol dehydrogenase family)
VPGKLPVYCRSVSWTFTLITGANTGIGLELARLAAADGRHLILVVQNASTLDTTAGLRHNVTVLSWTHWCNVRAAGLIAGCLVDLGDSGAVPQTVREEPGAVSALDELIVGPDAAVLVEDEDLQAGACRLTAAGGGIKPGTFAPGSRPLDTDPFHCLSPAQPVAVRPS